MQSTWFDAPDVASSCERSRPVCGGVAVGNHGHQAQLLGLTDELGHRGLRIEGNGGKAGADGTQYVRGHF